MQGSLHLSMTGLDAQDYAYVTLSFLRRTGQDEFAHCVLWEGKISAEDITESMSIQQWALDTLSRHSDFLRQFLAMQIEQGSKKFMSDLPER